MTKQMTGVVFKEFPAQKDLFAADLVPFMDRIIEKHGPEEWKLGVLTQELHGHLGLYTIVGTKMGLLAKELLGAEKDCLSVVVFAGNRPPISCIIDGIQVSTGATLGHGLIKTKNEEDPLPAADFSFNRKTIRLDLKKSEFDQIRKDISLAVAKYGTDSPEYWKEVRHLAIQYWLELDREKIFKITESK